MPGPVYKDSLRRSEPPSMLFDTIRNPHAPPLPPQKNIKPADTIESTQGKLNREVLARFQGEGKVLSHDNYAAVIHVGKYMFLAIMLPPYLLLYGVPKWLILNMMPQVFSFMRDQTLHVGRYVQQLSKHVVDIMKGLIDQMIGESLRMMGRKGQDIFKSLLATLNRGINASQGTLRSIQLKVKQTIKNVLRPFQEQYQKLVDGLDRATNYARESAGKLATAMSNGLNSLAQPAINLFAAISMPSFRFPENPGEKFKQWTQNLSTAFVSGLKNISKGTLVGAKNLLKKSVEAARKVAKPIVESLRKAYEAVDQQVRRIVHQTAEFTTKSVDFAAHHMQQVQQIVVQAAYRFWDITFQKPVDRVRSGVRAIRGWGQSAKEWYSSLKNKRKQMVRRMQKYIADAVNPIITLWEWLNDILAWLKAILWREFIELPQRTIRGAKSLGKWLRASLKRFGHFCRLAVAWTNALTHCAFQLLRESVTEINLWIRSISRS